MAVRLAAFGTGALSASLAVSLALLTTTGAAAQTSASQPRPVTGFVSTFEIMRTVRSAGFDPLVPPLREGTSYVLRATDFRGILMRVVLDARTGAIRDVTRIVPAASGPIGMMPPSYGGPPAYGSSALRLASRIRCSYGDGARRRAGAIVAAGYAVCDCSGAPAIPAAAAATADRTGLAKARYGTGTAANNSGSTTSASKPVRQIRSDSHGASRPPRQPRYRPRRRPRRAKRRPFRRSTTDPRALRRRQRRGMSARREKALRNPGALPLRSPDFRSSEVDAYAACFWSSITLPLVPLIGIERGFLASGISRTRSTCRRPFSRLAPLTWTKSASWNTRSKVRAAMP